jgi:hypothetical protein
MRERDRFGDACDADRGLSEMLGYVIIFGIVLSSVLLLSASGTSTLEEIRDTEQGTNAERAFDVVADNMAAVYQRDSPSRATEVDVGNSELYFGDQTAIEVELLKGGTVEESYSEAIRPVVLRTATDTKLVYEAGAVFRTEREGGTMLLDPPLLLSERRVHVPIIKTFTPSIQAVSGSTVLLRGKSTNRSVLFTPDTLASGPDELRLNVTSPRYEIWERHFEEETPLSCTTDPSTETVSCDMAITTDTVYVSLQEIELSLIL